MEKIKKKTFAFDKVKWAINILEPIKQPQKIFSSIIAKRCYHFISVLLITFRANYMPGTTHKRIGREAKVV